MLCSVAKGQSCFKDLIQVVAKWNMLLLLGYFKAAQLAVHAYWQIFCEHLKAPSLAHRFRRSHWSVLRRAHLWRH